MIARARFRTGDTVAWCAFEVNAAGVTMAKRRRVFYGHVVSDPGHGALEVSSFSRQVGERFVEGRVRTVSITKNSVRVIPGNA